MLSAFARTALVWDAPEWAVVPENARAEAGALDFKSGDQHTLSFSGDVVRASQAVTGSTFDFAQTPFTIGPEGWVLPEGEGALLLASGRRDAEGRFEVCRGRLETTSSIGTLDLAVISLIFIDSYTYMHIGPITKKTSQGITELGLRELDYQAKYVADSFQSGIADARNI